MKWIIAGTALLASTASAESIADPRALEICKSENAAFTEIAKCLPETDVALAVLDAFADIFGPDAQPIATRCGELNDDTTGSATCVINAVKDANKLAKQIGGAENLPDKTFQAAANPDALDALLKARKAAREKFPDVMIWGGGMYFPYK